MERTEAREEKMVKMQ